MPTFSQPQLDGSGSILCFWKHLYNFVACKTAQKICCLGAAQVGRIFSTDAPFAWSILLHVFRSVALHVALYITTKYCSNKVTSSSYISLFYYIDAGFTNTFVISKKCFDTALKVFLHLPHIDDVVSQPLRAWKKERVNAEITPRFDAILQIAIYFKSFSLLNSTHNSCQLGIQWYTHIAITTILLWKDLTRILLFDWTTFIARKNMRSSASSIMPGTKSERCQIVPNASS